MQQRNSEIEVLESLQKKGYVNNLIISSGSLFVNTVEGDGLSPEDCVVEEEHRFEGLSNPSDMSIIYAVRTDDGRKGTVVVNYGPNADTEAAEFFRQASYATSKE